MSVAQCLFLEENGSAGVYTGTGSSRIDRMAGKKALTSCFLCKLIFCALEKGTSWMFAGRNEP